MEFWKRDYGAESWRCSARTPAFEGDSRGPRADKLVVESTAAEYVDYARVLQKMDPSCATDNCVAFPRLAFEGWAPFVGGARSLFESCWRTLLPEGLKDLTPRWAKLFSAMFNLDWLEVLGRYFRVHLGAPGCISRLHCENHGAHCWISQIEGKRLFVLFSPRDVAAGCLHEDYGEVQEGAGPWTAAASPVDIFFPNQRRHGKFAEAKGKTVLLRPGDTLVIPGTWWYYSVVLEASVTLQHIFWNAQNRSHVVDEFREAFEEAKMPPELQERAAANFAELRERIVEDDDSDSE